MCYNNWNRPVGNKYQICNTMWCTYSQTCCNIPPNYMSDNAHQLGGSHCSECDDYCLLVYDTVWYG